MQKVSEEKAMEMLEVLPPKVWYKTETGEVFQVGEAASGNGRGLTYDTYEKVGADWFYRGEENAHRVAEAIMANPDA